MVDSDGRARPAPTPGDRRPAAVGSVVYSQYRSQAATAGQHSGHGQRQHRKQVMTRTPPVPGVGDAPENLDQRPARQGVRGGR